MEKTLKTLFDFQKFDGNPHLSKLIEETESLYENTLSDEDLDLVNAAGINPYEKQSDKHEDF